MHMNKNAIKNSRVEVDVPNGGPKFYRRIYDNSCVNLI